MFAVYFILGFFCLVVLLLSVLFGSVFLLMFPSVIFVGFLFISKKKSQGRAAHRRGSSVEKVVDVKDLRPFRKIPVWG